MVMNSIESGDTTYTLAYTDGGLVIQVSTPTSDKVFTEQEIDNLRDDDPNAFIIKCFDNLKVSNHEIR